MPAWEARVQCVSFFKFVWVKKRINYWLTLDRKSVSLGNEVNWHTFRYKRLYGKLKDLLWLRVLVACITSACFCAKARLMRVTSQQEDKQTWENCVWVAEKRTIWNIERFRRSQNLLTGLRNHCFKQQKGNQLVITKKNNEPNQKSTEIVFNKNAKMVYSVMVKSSLSHTFHWSGRTCRKPAS